MFSKWIIWNSFKKETSFFFGLWAASPAPVETTNDEEGKRAKPASL